VKQDSICRSYSKTIAIIFQRVFTLNQKILLFFSHGFDPEVMKNRIEEVNPAADVIPIPDGKPRAVQEVCGRGKAVLPFPMQTELLSNQTGRQRNTDPGINRGFCRAGDQFTVKSVTAAELNWNLA
jgi:hypothetical protein